ncbi:response regulator [Iningainema tapete]|uniref:Response regulator n=1 Tax=Iningainema tapete BLCC-T55 TaxID=2748662 RepID=A0A8J6XLC5_9CYAN|nr:response regulator [Iningainema tapete]MBD2778449.1 response regulator [Iningainema tapete BLCC-T55]
MCDQSLRLNGLRLLVIDDDADANEILTFLFSEEGAKIVAAATASEALEVLSHFQPDILISDIRLPDYDGYLLLFKIRNLIALQGKQIPAIALTAFSGQEYRKRSMLAGFDIHLSKPIDLDELVSVVESLVCTQQSSHAYKQT